MDYTKPYLPLLHFLSGLIVTSIALIAAAFAAMKDAWPIPDWQAALLDFIAWMALVILVATFVAAVLQLRRCVVARNATAAVTPKLWEWALTLLPALPGLVATAHLVALAVGHKAFWLW